MKGKNDVPTNPNPDAEEIIETTETEEVSDVRAEEIPVVAPQEESDDSKEDCSDESMTAIAEEVEESEVDVMDDIDDIDDVEPVQLNQAAYEPKVSKVEDSEPLTKGEFKNFKSWSIFTVIIAAILLLWIGCIFADGIMSGMKTLSRQMADVKESVVVEPEKDVRETSVTGELTAVRVGTVNGETTYTLRIGSDYGVDVPVHIYEDVKDHIGSIIEFHMYEEEKDGTTTIYFDYEFHTVG